jgi:NitT/TauT family transport system permease protein
MISPSTGLPEAPVVPSRQRRRRLGDYMAALYLVSIGLGIVLWFLAASLNRGNRLLPGPVEVLQAALAAVSDGTLFANIGASLLRVVIGFALGVLLAIPAGFLMGWYDLARGLIEPWVQFLRTIPPIALTPMVILFLGIGESSKIFLIFFAAFLASTIATFGGVRNVDVTLIKAARVLGAKDRTIFFEVVVPAAFPYILVGMRLALGSAWGTLVAAELIAANSGLGFMMQNAALYFQVPTIMVGIVVIGVLGFVMDRGLLLLERRLTAWQEKQV